MMHCWIFLLCGLLFGVGNGDWVKNHTRVDSRLGGKSILCENLNVLVQIGGFYLKQDGSFDDVFDFVKLFNLDTFDVLKVNVTNPSPEGRSGHVSLVLKDQSDECIFIIFGGHMYGSSGDAFHPSDNWIGRLKPGYELEWLKINGNDRFPKLVLPTGMIGFVVDTDEKEDNSICNKSIVSRIILFGGALYNGNSVLSTSYNDVGEFTVDISSCRENFSSKISNVAVHRRNNGGIVPEPRFEMVGAEVRDSSGKKLIKFTISGGRELLRQLDGDDNDGENEKESPSQGEKKPPPKKEKEETDEEQRANHILVKRNWIVFDDLWTYDIEKQEWTNTIQGSERTIKNDVLNQAYGCSQTFRDSMVSYGGLASTKDETDKFYYHFALSSTKLVQIIEKQQSRLDNVCTNGDGTYCVLRESESNDNPGTRYLHSCALTSTGKFIILGGLSSDSNVFQDEIWSLNIPNDLNKFAQGDLYYKDMFGLFTDFTYPNTYSSLHVGWSILVGFAMFFGILLIYLFFQRFVFRKNNNENNTNQNAATSANQPNGDEGSIATAQAAHDQQPSAPQNDQETVQTSVVVQI